jgi:YHS domain-containing protein
MELADKPCALGKQRGASILDLGRGPMHATDATVLRDGRMGRPASRHVLEGSPGQLERDMAIEKDPVCGMEVDTEQSDLSYEHDGKTYWFCGRGCLLDFKDDPEKYLDPEYVPAM